MYMVMRVPMKMCIRMNMYIVLVHANTVLYELVHQRVTCEAVAEQAISEKDSMQYLEI